MHGQHAARLTVARQAVPSGPSRRVSIVSCHGQTALRLAVLLVGRGTVSALRG
jgi:hypothetical protein